MKELYKYQVIKKLVKTNGNKKRAALKLNCTIRTINRLIIEYKNNGKQGFVHGNRFRKPAITKDSKLKEKVLSIYRQDFPDTNFQHFTEILSRIYHIEISKTTIKRWLDEVHVLSPKATRLTKKRMTKRLRALSITTTSN